MIFKNYAVQSVSDKGKAHEDAIASARASLRSVGEQRISGKSIRFAQSLRAINDFPKSPTATSLILSIQSNFQTASSSEVQPKTKMLKLNLTEVKFHY